MADEGDPRIGSAGNRKDMLEALQAMAMAMRELMIGLTDSLLQ